MQATEWINNQISGYDLSVSTYASCSINLFQMLLVDRLMDQVYIFPIPTAINLCPSYILSAGPASLEQSHTYSNYYSDYLV